MKFGPINIGSWKWEMSLNKKGSFDEQMLKARTDIIVQCKHLEEMSEGYKRSIRYNERMGEDTEEDWEELNKTIRALNVVRQVEKRLKRISSQQELNQTLNRLDDTLKEINSLDKNRAEVRQESLERGLKKMQDNGEKEGGAGLFQSIEVSESDMKKYVRGEVDLDKLLFDLRKSKSTGVISESDIPSSIRTPTKEEQAYTEDESPIDPELTREMIHKSSDSVKKDVLKEQMKNRGI